MSDNGEQSPLPEVDWSSVLKFPAPLVYCRCGAQYRSHTKLVINATGFTHVSRLPCPVCGKQVDHQAQVSHDAEVMTLDGWAAGSVDKTLEPRSSLIAVPEPDCGLGAHTWAYSKAKLVEFAQAYADVRHQDILDLLTALVAAVSTEGQPGLAHALARAQGLLGAHTRAKEGPRIPQITFTVNDINDLQLRSIRQVIGRAKYAHMTDIHMRINGKDEVVEADWLKRLTELPFRVD